MSQENVDVVKAALDAFNRRDIAAFVMLTTSDYEWFPSMVSVVERGSFQGPAGIEEYFRESESTWEKLLVLGEDFREVEDRVVVLGRTEGTGRTSGVRADTEIGMVCDMRDGKLSRVRAFLDHAQALKAVGLEE